MDPAHRPNWSTDVELAAWIGPRLSPFNDPAITSVIPSGFEAYARLLHPVEVPDTDRGHVVRWRDVSAWSSTPMTPDVQFHSISLTGTPQSGAIPWQGQGPRRGTLYSGDAEVLARRLRGWTDVPDECRFCMWEGYGFWQPVPRSSPPRRAGRLPHQIPSDIRDGPRVRLPNRDYFLYVGAVEAVSDFFQISRREQSPNLWWPEDHAWCVATEIDLAWSYVGGSRTMIDSLLAISELEVLPADPNDSVHHVDELVSGWVEIAVAQLYESGETAITTVLGQIKVRVELPTARRRTGWIHFSRERSGSTGSGKSRLTGNPVEVRDSIVRTLESTIIDFADG